MPYSKGVREPWVMNQDRAVMVPTAQIEQRINRHVEKHGLGAEQQQRFMDHLNEFKRKSLLNSKGHCHAMVALWAKATLVDASAVNREIKVADSQHYQQMYARRGHSRNILGKSPTFAVASDKMYDALGLKHTLDESGNATEVELQAGALAWEWGGEMLCFDISMETQAHSIGIRVDKSRKQFYIMDPAYGLYLYDNFDTLAADLINTLKETYPECIGREYSVYNIELK